MGFERYNPLDIKVTLGDVLKRPGLILDLFDRTILESKLNRAPIPDGHHRLYRELLSKLDQEIKGKIST